MFFTRDISIFCFYNWNKAVEEIPQFWWSFSLAAFWFAVMSFEHYLLLPNTSKEMCPDKIRTGETKIRKWDLICRAKDQLNRFLWKILFTDCSRWCRHKYFIPSDHCHVDVGQAIVTHVTLVVTRVMHMCPSDDMRLDRLYAIRVLIEFGLCVYFRGFDCWLCDVNIS